MTSTTPATFAWTATHDTADYESYPPYVNLTGNRLAVRGPEKIGAEYREPGDYVIIELPQEAIAGLALALRARAATGGEQS